MAGKPMQYEVSNPEIQTTLRRLAELLNKDIPQGWGFMLMIFEFSPGNSLFYISNADRQKIINAMREFVKKYGAN